MLQATLEPDKPVKAALTCDMQDHPLRFVRRALTVSGKPTITGSTAVLAAREGCPCGDWLPLAAATWDRAINSRIVLAERLHPDAYGHWTRCALVIFVSGRIGMPKEGASALVSGHLISTATDLRWHVIAA
ncbi:hypothetical protein K458DRAFT_390313 [Lentithecium fluviatile CBS 122367]|uniref:Uncharacterized protein n=1 Tax=Lentithecium fluviatile CBS 122367 TaxID=1168545 RepID=A0A6G1IY50_9PLEO|nr:hypothetical protein K458DRAFT_390313 [Lentithecium fluviatile CBS 122367]